MQLYIMLGIPFEIHFWPFPMPGRLFLQFLPGLRLGCFSAQMFPLQERLPSSPNILIRFPLPILYFSPILLLS